MNIGASFSHRHLKYLGLDPKKALVEFKNLGLGWIRLSIYWDESEPEKGKYNFKDIEFLVKYCEMNNISVILTVGMKAQRWPEYYLPYWIKGKVKTDLTRKITFGDNQELRKSVLKLIEKTVKHFNKYKCIRYWHIENEPSDPSGENWWRIDTKILEEEINLVKKLDPKRKIMTNLAGNEITKRQIYKPLVHMSDAVGFNFYLRLPIRFFKLFTRYIKPLDSQESIKNILNQIKSEQKEVWITELQTEPWEPGEIVARSPNPPSFKSEHFEENLRWANFLDADGLLFWGFEYWYWRKSTGDDRYWNEAKKILTANVTNRYII